MYTGGRPASRVVGNHGAVERKRAHQGPATRLGSWTSSVDLSEKVWCFVSRSNVYTRARSATQCLWDSLQVYTVSYIKHEITRLQVSSRYRFLVAIGDFECSRFRKGFQ